MHEVANGMGMDERIGRRFLNASLGFGGSCFPKDLSAFIKIAEQVGYDFGLLTLKTFITESLYTKDDFGGLLIWTKLAFRLWGPDLVERPAPLIHK